MCKKIYLFIIFLIPFYTNANELINAISNIYSHEKIDYNMSESNLKCSLKSHEVSAFNGAKIKISKDDIFSYSNALMQIANRSSALSAVSQDLIIRNAKDGRILSSLLGMQLYITGKCPRCAVILDSIGFNYNKTKDATIKDILKIEGGDFAKSYALSGEAFLCKALKSNNANDFLYAYANFMMAGIHSRAINTLLLGLANSKKSYVLINTFVFLASIDYVISRNDLGAILLQSIYAQTNKNPLSIIKSLRNFENLKVLDYDSSSNSIVQGLLTMDMKREILLSPLDKRASKESIKEYFDKQKYYEQELKNDNLNIIKKNLDSKQVEQYLRILELKSRLKRHGQYPYIKVFFDSNI